MISEVHNRRVIIKKLLLRVVIDHNGCWIWQGYVHGNGYGYIKQKCKKILIHKIFFMLHKGIVPKGMCLDHICRIRRCVNPEHLRTVTRAQNNVENSISPSAINKAKTRCKRGHKFTLGNTYIRKRGSVAVRNCRACKRESNNYTARKRESVK